MCLYPKLIRNKKYAPNTKNKGIIPLVCDTRTLYVPIACGQCMECRKHKKNEWTIRLQEDIKEYKNGKFITLTFSNENLKHIYNEVQSWIIYEQNKITNKVHSIINDKERLKLQKTYEKLEQKKYGYPLDNEIATFATRFFLERYRKHNKKSLRHWLVTELGHNGTENIHLHGIIWTDKSLNEIEEHWQYGWMWKGKEINGKLQNYVNERTINYITKYITKQDLKHPNYKSIILTSPGIGKHYIKNLKLNNNKFNDLNTNETYRTSSGHKLSIPIYYRNHIYTEEEKEKLWINKLNKNTRYIDGQEIDISNGYDEYYNILKCAQEKNIRLGYGTDKKDWNKIKYETELRILNTQKRLNNASGGPYAGGG